MQYLSDAGEQRCARWSMTMQKDSNEIVRKGCLITHHLRRLKRRPALTEWMRYLPDAGEQGCARWSMIMQTDSKNVAREGNL